MPGAGFIDRLLWIFIVVFFCASCQNSHVQNLRYGIKSVERVSLTPDLITESDSLIGSYALYYIDDDHLLFKFPQGFFFKSWNVKTSSVEASFLRKGRGPGEYPSLGAPSIIHSGSGKVLMDIATNDALITLDLYQLLSDPKGVIIDKLPFDGIAGDGIVLDAYRLADGFLCQVVGDADVYSFKLISDKKVLKSFPIPPLLDASLPENSYVSDYQLRPDKSALVLPMYRFNRLIIIGLDDSRIKNIRTYKDDSGVYDSATCSQKYIYVVYKHKNGGQEIQVFDWDGHFIQVFELDYSLMSIAVNEDDTILYALTTDSKLLTLRIR